MIPLAYDNNINIVASCWRYPVQAALSTGCPCTVVLQLPLAVQNLLFDVLEWRLLPFSGRADKLGAVAATIEQGDLMPQQSTVLHSLQWGGRYAVQLRLAGYEWSTPIDVDANSPSDKLELVKLRPTVAGSKGLRLCVQHRSTCATSSHLLQANTAPRERTLHALGRHSACAARHARNSCAKARVEALEHAWKRSSTRRGIHRRTRMFALTRLGAPA
eukprot:2616890-Pleurochrysis_carterae.AAC.1